MASWSEPDHGRRLVTAATAPATAPRTVVVALVNVEGFFGFFRVALRPDREATARAAVFRFTLFVLQCFDEGEIRFRVSIRTNVVGPFIPLLSDCVFGKKLRDLYVA